MIDLFPERVSQVLILTYYGPKFLPSLQVPDNYILILILTPNLDQIIPYFATEETNIKEITNFIENKYGLRVTIVRYLGHIKDLLVDDQKIGNILEARREQVLFVIHDSEYVMRKDIPEQINFPDLFVTVSDWGQTTPRTLEYNSKIYKRDLYFNAIARGIDTNLPLEEISKKFLTDYPSIKWQENNLLKFTDLPEREKEMVADYTNYGSISINSYYRSAKIIDPNYPYYNIERAIEKMPPLDKEITVFRSVREAEFLSADTGSVVELKGYLSTTINASATSSAVCPKQKDQEKSYSVMIIKVPKGKKAIFAPGREAELIFPLNTNLRLDDYQLGGQFPCQGSYDDTYYMHNLPVFKYTML